MKDFIKSAAIIVGLMVLMISCNSDERIVKKFRKKGNYALTHMSPTWKLSPLECIRYYNDTLIILVQLDDCGEWGGHTEKLVLYGVDQNKVFAHYSKDSVKCNEMDTKQPLIIKDTVIQLDNRKQKQVSLFIQKLIEVKLFNICISNSGNYYQISTSDSTLNIIFYDTRKIWKGYEKLKTEFDLD